jgi:hypothetical protein
MSGNDRCVRAKRVGRRREKDYRGPWVSHQLPTENVHSPKLEHVASTYANATMSFSISYR